MSHFTRTTTPALLACALGCLPAAHAATILGFESLADLEPVGSQFAALGVSFADTIALKAAFSLNEGEFPPHSGSLVVSDDGGPISLLFSTPMALVGGFFTYTQPLTLTAYDAANVALGSVASAFASNAALSGAAGSAPNEWLQLGFAGGISRLTISGAAGGGSFVLDDLSITAVPEPAPAALLALGLAVLAGFAGLRRPLSPAA